MVIEEMLRISCWDIEDTLKKGWSWTEEFRDAVGRMGTDNRNIAYMPRAELVP